MAAHVGHAKRGLAFRGALGATLLLIGLFAMVASIGILSAQIIPNSERVLMDLAQKLPHPLLGGLALAGVLAAISSTMDSSLNVSNLTLTRDIIRALYAPTLPRANCCWPAACQRRWCARPPSRWR